MRDAKGHLSPASRRKAEALRKELQDMDRDAKRAHSLEMACKYPQVRAGGQFSLLGTRPFNIPWGVGTSAIFKT